MWQSTLIGRAEIGKREKAAEKNAALGVEKFTVEVAGVFKADLKRLMKQHDFNNQQEVFQNLLRNVIAERLLGLPRG